MALPHDLEAALAAVGPGEAVYLEPAGAPRPRVPGAAAKLAGVGRRVAVCEAGGVRARLLEARGWVRVDLKDLSCHGPDRASVPPEEERCS